MKYFLYLTIGCCCCMTKTVADWHDDVMSSDLFNNECSSKCFTQFRHNYKKHLESESGQVSQVQNQTVEFLDSIAKKFFVDRKFTTDGFITFCFDLLKPLEKCTDQCQNDDSSPSSFKKLVSKLSNQLCHKNYEKWLSYMECHKKFKNQSADYCDEECAEELGSTRIRVKSLLELSKRKYLEEIPAETSQRIQADIDENIKQSLQQTCETASCLISCERWFLKKVCKADKLLEHVAIGKDLIRFVKETFSSLKLEKFWHADCDPIFDI